MFYGRKAVIMPNATASEGRCLYMCRLTPLYVWVNTAICVSWYSHMCRLIRIYSLKSDAYHVKKRLWQLVRTPRLRSLAFIAREPCREKEGISIKKIPWGNDSSATTSLAHRQKTKRQTSPPSRPKEIALSLFVHMSRLVIYWYQGLYKPCFSYRA